MRERIGTDHCLVGLNDKPCGLAHHTACGQDLLGVDVHVKPKVVPPGFDCHYDLLQRAIARALAQAVDGAFHLACTANLYACQRIGNCHTQVVMAMHRPDRFV